MAKRKANYDLLRIIAMLGIIMFHHFGSRTPNRFVELSSGFTNSTYFYDFINNVPGKVSSVSLLMDFCYGHLGNGGNLVFMLQSQTDIIKTVQQAVATEAVKSKTEG